MPFHLFQILRVGVVAVVHKAGKLLCSGDKNEVGGELAVRSILDPNGFEKSKDVLDDKVGPMCQTSNLDQIELGTNLTGGEGDYKGVPQWKQTSFTAATMAGQLSELRLTMLAVFMLTSVNISSMCLAEASEFSLVVCLSSFRMSFAPLELCT